MKIFIEYFILTFPLNFELLTDFYRIEKQKREDNHRGDIPVRIAMCLAAGFLLKILGFTDGIFEGFFYSGSAFILFDPFLNILRGKNFFHKGDNALDELWKNHTDPISEVFVRLWVIAVAVITYYQFEETIFNFIKW
jgi:hypothetical protein